MATVFARAEDKALDDFTTPWQILLLLCRFLIAVFRYFAALYLTLLFFAALPNDRFYKNVIALGALALLLCVMGVANVNPYLGLVVLFGQVMLVCYLYDLDFKGGVCFAVLLFCLSPLVMLLWQLAVGMLAGAAGA